MAVYNDDIKIRLMFVRNDGKSFIEYIIGMEYVNFYLNRLKKSVETKIEGIDKNQTPQQWILTLEI